jgi:predicted phosphodiesterase
MKNAIFSDVHANIQALEAVWDDIQRQDPDAVYCLGDLVGYGANPNEAIEFIRKHEIPTIMGNYDNGVGLELDSCGCKYNNSELERLGELSIWWSRGQTSQANKDFLKELPKEIRLNQQEQKSVPRSPLNESRRWQSATSCYLATLTFRMRNGWPRPYS